MSEILFRRGGLPELAGSFEIPPGRCFLVSSPGVLRFHGEAVRLALSTRRTVELEMEDGEPAKSWDTLRRLTDAAIEAGIRRDDFLVAFGGGVVTDVAGFAAAILLRGVAWLAVPTTLLGMADAAIGGKTAIDHPRGKNLLGAFHPPLGVLIDPSLLDTLPPRQFRSGLAEVYKSALIGDEDVFRAMAGRLETIAASRQVDESLEAAVAFKRRIVERDPRELGERIVLNFGHTLGHALERWDGYRRFTHGECVCVGMAAALDLSADRCGFPKAEADALSRELMAFAGREIVVALEPEAPELWEALSHDKKFTAAGRPAVLLARPGEPRIVEVSAEEWRRALVRVRDRIVL